MSHTIEDAQWGNEDQTSAVIFTKEAGAVAISAADTPKAWEAFQAWARKNPVRPTPQSIRTPLTPEQKLARIGLTKDDLKALLGE